MKRQQGWLAIAAGSVALTGSVWFVQAQRRPLTETQTYLQTIRETAEMVNDREAVALARRCGLNVLNLTWEDTGRYKNSAVGPNISDMTIQVGAEGPNTRRFRVTCMPVIRYPNFSDKTCDLDPRDFTLLVGNQDGIRLKRISLYDFLAEPTAYLSKPESWKGRHRTLLCNRDSKVLVSAQACFLPVPKSGKATFNPVVFNYQSTSGDPAVLTVLATREGTSVTVIDNKRDTFETGAVWGQRLFHNQDGQRASLTGQRMSDYVAGDPQTIPPGEEDDRRPERRAGLNMVLLIQIPLKQKNPVRFNAFDDVLADSEVSDFAPKGDLGKRSSDVEEAVIGHGAYEGPFTEIDNLAIERDTRFPVRVTVQFYKATSNGVVSANDMRTLKEQIDRVYARSAFVGSLVTDGTTGRITEYEGAKVQSPDWWERFWERHQRNTGDSPEEARRKLRELLGVRYWDRPVCDLYLRNLLHKRG
jgi:hypothetical protein